VWPSTLGAVAALDRSRTRADERPHRGLGCYVNPLSENSPAANDKAGTRTLDDSRPAAALAVRGIPARGCPPARWNWPPPRVRHSVRHCARESDHRRQLVTAGGSRIVARSDQV